MSHEPNNTQPTPQAYKRILLALPLLALTFLYGLLCGIGVVTIWVNSRLPAVWTASLALSSTPNTVLFNFMDDAVGWMLLLRIGGFILAALTLLLAAVWMGVRTARKSG